MKATADKAIDDDRLKCSICFAELNLTLEGALMSGRLQIKFKTWVICSCFH